MIDLGLLKDLGFEKGKGWDHEVWTYKGMCWVHYFSISMPPDDFQKWKIEHGMVDRDRLKHFKGDIDGEKSSLADFIKEFTWALLENLRDNAYVCFPNDMDRL